MTRRATALAADRRRRRVRGRTRPRIGGSALAFLAICAAAALLGAGYVGVALVRSGRGFGAGAPAGSSAALATVLREPHLVYLVPSGGDPEEDEVAVTPLAHPAAGRVLTGLRCSRMYAATGSGICVGENAAGVGNFLDASLRPDGAFLRPGIASRARVSADGRWTSTTVFVAGHSYAQGTFSTQTLITDRTTGVTVDAESFTVTRAGRPFQSPDFNFWGVTFAGGGRFYATLGTGGRTYLVAGDVGSHTATVLRDGVECPSLSPDGTRIVYKSAIPGSRPKLWRLHVLDLRTMRDVALGETRSVDDQAEWLDDDTVLYGLNDQGPPPTLDMNLWALPVAGGPPRLYLRHAASPAVVRTARAQAPSATTPGRPA